jgi:hypothetical protein
MFSTAHLANESHTADVRLGQRPIAETLGVAAPDRRGELMR